MNKNLVLVGSFAAAFLLTVFGFGYYARHKVYAPNFQAGDCIINKLYTKQQREPEVWEESYTLEQLVKEHGIRILQVGKQAYKVRFLSWEKDHQDYKNLYTSESFSWDETYTKVSCPKE